MTSTSCVSVSLYNESLIVFLNCKSLWIKASAKLINIKCMIKLQRYIKSQIISRPLMLRGV